MSAPSTDGLILLPTKGRQHRFKRYICQWYAMGCSIKHVVIIEKHDVELYETVGWPSEWILRVFEGGTGACSHHNKIFEEFPNEAFYASMSDDVFPLTPEWDMKLAAACQPDKVAYGNEGIDRTATHGAQHFPAHCFIGGDLVRKWGFIVPPGLNHFYCDNWWFDAGPQVVLPEINMRHEHFKNGLAERDATYNGRPSSHMEEEFYERFCREHKHLIPSGIATLHRRKLQL